MNCLALPEGYAQIAEIDLQKNKKQALIVNLGALLIAAVLAMIGFQLAPFDSMFVLEPSDSMVSSLAETLIKLVVLIVGMIAYIILHEAVHGIFMKRYGKIKPKFGFTGLYAYCGSDAYFDKKSYLIIGLSPVILWGVVLLIANLLAPIGWFWIIYMIQIINLSGAAGDAYVTYRMLRLPPDILVQDSGTAMVVYAPAIQQEQEKEGE